MNEHNKHKNEINYDEKTYIFFLVFLKCLNSDVFNSNNINTKNKNITVIEFLLSIKVIKIKLSKNLPKIPRVGFGTIHLKVVFRASS
jgi:hypothetical protein